MKKKEIDIKKLCKEYKKTSDKLSRLSYQLGEHYNPIIEQLTDNNDHKSLSELIHEIPDSMVKLGVYQGIRIIKEKLKID